MVCLNCRQADHNDSNCPTRCIQVLLDIMNTGRVQVNSISVDSFEILDESGRAPNHPEFDLFTKLKTDFPESSATRVRIGIDPWDYMRQKYNPDGRGYYSTRNYKLVRGILENYVYPLSVFGKSGVGFTTEDPTTYYIPALRQGTRPRKNSDIPRRTFCITYDVETRTYASTIVDMPERELRTRMDKQTKMFGVIYSEYMFVVDTDVRDVFRGTVRRLRRLENQQRELRRGNPPPPPHRPVATNHQPLCAVSGTAYETPDCPICMEGIGETNKCVLRCGHQYCTDCIFHHFQQKRGVSCPTCRLTYAVKI